MRSGATKNLGFIHRAFCYADQEILRLRGVYAERREGLRLRITTRRLRLSFSFPRSLPMTPVLLHRDKGAVAIERGPLVYALRIGEDWRRVHRDQPYRELPHADWEVCPTTPWNYALDVHEATLSDEAVFSESPVGDCPFSPEGAPISLKVKGRRLPSWEMENGFALETPEGAFETRKPEEELELIPYGCTNLRIAEFPEG